MKVEILGTGKITDAKIYSEFTDEEIDKYTDIPEIWDGNEIFVADDEGFYVYMYDEEIKVIADEVGR
jgi:hypothetical protein